MIDTSPTDISIVSVNFNAAFIKKNKVKSVTIIIVDKPDGNVIIDKGASKGYEFDQDGYVTRYYETILNRTESQEIQIPPVKKRGKLILPARTRLLTKYINDTLFVKVFYDAKKRVIMKRVQAGDYYNTYYYEYNDKNQLKKELHCKETNVSDNKKEFKLGVQKILSSETFEYTALTEVQIKKSCLNDEGREYKKAIINYNSKGSKLTESYEFMVSWMHQESTFQYDSNEKLVKRSFVSNEGASIDEYSIFEYSKGSVLISELKFKNNVLTDEINYLYDETNTLIKSEVNRDHRNASIGIVKYAYTFY
jgi:hypothetical protein